MSENKYINLLDVLSAEHTLPEGFDSWGFKTIGFDGRTKHGFEWPEPGGIAKAPDMLDHNDSRPRRHGDGLSVALSWAGMASGGMRAFCLLLVAYRSGEARGSQAQELRVPEVAVVARIDGERLVRDRGHNADLSYADLRGADLRYADLYRADLYRANLYGANLSNADLRDADLYGAELSNADLRGANLRNANLCGAELRHANLRDADLRGAELRHADLRDSDLRGANLYGANLYGADLYDADLRDADLDGADYIPVPTC